MIMLPNLLRWLGVYSTTRRRAQRVREQPAVQSSASREPMRRERASCVAKADMRAACCAAGVINNSARPQRMGRRAAVGGRQ